MANQIMIAASMMGTAEAMIYSHKAGIDISEMINLLSGGAAASFTLSNLAPKMLNRDFAPGFFAEHFLKDLEIANSEMEKVGVELKGTKMVADLY